MSNTAFHAKSQPALQTALSGTHLSEVTWKRIQKYMSDIMLFGCLQEMSDLSRMSTD